MTQAYLEKNMKQTQDILSNPQQFYKQIQDAQQNFFKEWNSFIHDIPSKTQNYLLEKQKDAQELNEQVQEVLKKDPHDWSQVSNLWLDYQSTSFSKNLEHLQDHQERLYRLYSSYFNVDMPDVFKDFLQNSHDEIKKTTNEVLNATEAGIKKTNHTLKENSSKITQQLKKSQKKADKS